MCSDDSRSQDNVAALIKLLEYAESGMLDSISCPECGAPSISVWFTNPCESEYRTWFVCSQCDFSLRTQDSGRPTFFSADRINEKLQSYDQRILAKIRRKNRDSQGIDTEE